MAESKHTQERIYTIPLRRHWMHTPQYKRSRKALVAIKEFIAKHMKIPNRDVSKVRVDILLNNEVWFRGSRKPPAKIKVKATRENDIVKVTFAEVPEYVKFIQARLEKRNTPKEAPKAEDVITEDKKVETSEEKKEEKEKEQSVAESKEKEIKQDKKAAKHTPKPEKIARPTKAATGR